MILDCKKGVPGRPASEIIGKGKSIDYLESQKFGHNFLNFSKNACNQIKNSSVPSNNFVKWFLQKRQVSNMVGVRWIDNSSTYPDL